MLPRWGLEETFERLAAHGYQAVELRCRYNPDDPAAEPSFWGRHLADVSPDNVVQLAPRIRAAAAATGVRVAALAPAVQLGQEGELAKLLRGATAIDPERPPMIRVGAARYDRAQPYLPQFDAARAGYAALLAMSQPFGAKILYEIHVGTIAVSCSRARELLRDLDPVGIGAIYDIPNMVRVGLEDSRMGMEVLGPYLAHCHIGNGLPVAGQADSQGQIPWQWQFCGLQAGVADIAQIVADFRAISYAGCLSLEDFGPGEDDEKVGGQGAYLRRLLAV
jgi:sugar phosphate isomerase/epimerase